MSSFNRRDAPSWARKRFTFATVLRLIRGVSRFIIAAWFTAIAVSRPFATSGESPSPTVDDRSVHSPDPPTPERAPTVFEGVHIIQTRFMQFQPDMLHLGTARLKLFKTFCLPTMKRQTAKNFLWIIKTDPRLRPELRSELVDLVKDRPNFILLGSNYNKYWVELDGDEPFENYLMGDKNSAAEVWSGNLTLMKDAYERAKQKKGIVLETRLDADDGLHHQYIRNLQKEALRHLFFASSDQYWRIWCVHTHVKWYPVSPTTVDDGSGYLKTEVDKGCITPGLTYGVGTLSSRKNVSRYLRHDRIAKNVKDCAKSKEGIGCAGRMKSITWGAIRSRTPTSAGMNDVVVGGSGATVSQTVDANTPHSSQMELWESALVRFRISKSNVISAQRYLINHRIDIARENLESVCKKGTMEFCKKSAKEKLQAYIDGAESNSIGRKK
mmetsp:Transcript_12747/g.27534  ORF Transcript_12747/g.27534 Transcript_12747/m.27534 type:complete len:440 (+) Transcript_12747:238-1557(+)